MKNVSKIATKLNNLAFFEKTFIPPVDEQIKSWKTIFDLLMSHPLAANRTQDPQTIPLSKLPKEVKGTYIQKLNEIYTYINDYLTSEEDLAYLRKFYDEDYNLINSLNLTHEMFIYCVFRLVILMDKIGILDENVEVEVKQLISSKKWLDLKHYHEYLAPRVFKLPQYPMCLVAPILLAGGEINIKDFIEAYILYDYPFGLAAIPTKLTDVHGGTIYTPAHFFGHDLLHWPPFVKMVNCYPNRWERIREPLRALYIKNQNKDKILDYFIFMILHEGVLIEEFGKDKKADIQKDIVFLINQIYEEMTERFDYHKTVIKIILIYKLQLITSKLYKVFEVDEIDNKRLDVISYEQTSPSDYEALASLSFNGTKLMTIRCKISGSPTTDPFYYDYDVTQVEIIEKSPESIYEEDYVSEKLLGPIVAYSPRYCFRNDVIDHLTIFKKITGYSGSEEDTYKTYLPWIKKETLRVLNEYKL